MHESEQGDLYYAAEVKAAYSCVVSRWRASVKTIDCVKHGCSLAPSFEFDIVAKLWYYSFCIGHVMSHRRL